MRLLALDTETSTFNKGHPFDKRNELVCWSYATTEKSDALLWGDGNLQELLDKADLIITFNGKFDLQWLVKYGITYNPAKVWDVQIAEFIRCYQTRPYLSLNEVCEIHKLPKKLDVIKEEYWEKNIDTKDIPWDILREYAAHDADLHLKCFQAQFKLMSPAQKALCRLQSQDMSILREMEACGIPFNEELCHSRAEELDAKIQEIKQELAAVYPNVPINFNSGDHVSAFLYGGVVKEDAKEFVGYYKTGIKAGQPKYTNIVIEHTLPQVYRPIKGSELAKEGFYATNEATLRQLKGKPRNVNLLLELAKLEKLNGTYYRGLVKLREEMDWPKGLLHGNFVQTTARTGRLSSSKPNLQNFASELQDIFISKYWGLFCGMLLLHRLMLS